MGSQSAWNTHARFVQGMKWLTVTSLLLIALRINGCAALSAPSQAEPGLLSNEPGANALLMMWMCCRVASVRRRRHPTRLSATPCYSTVASDDNLVINIWNIALINHAPLTRTNRTMVLLVCVSLIDPRVGEKGEAVARLDPASRIRSHPSAK